MNKYQVRHEKAENASMKRWDKWGYATIRCSTKGPADFMAVSRSFDRRHVHAIEIKTGDSRLSPQQWEFAVTCEKTMVPYWIEVWGFKRGRPFLCMTYRPAIEHTKNP